MENTAVKTTPIERALQVQKVPLAQLMTLIAQRTIYAKNGDKNGVEYINGLMQKYLGIIDKA